MKIHNEREIVENEPVQKAKGAFSRMAAFQHSGSVNPYFLIENSF